MDVQNISFHLEPGGTSGSVHWSDTKGFRYHYWCDPADLLPATLWGLSAPRIFVNKDTPEGEPRYTTSRRDPRSKANRAIIKHLIHYVHLNGLVRREVDRVAREAEEEAERHQSEWRVAKTREAGPGLYLVMHRIVKLATDGRVPEEQCADIVREAEKAIRTVQKSFDDD
tara:strand:+ start:28703 stop:29212 length:510 start_codon:yes stop_codon:yes gene_type:complete